jgi:hypothetical protein
LPLRLPALSVRVGGGKQQVAISLFLKSRAQRGIHIATIGHRIGETGVRLLAGSHSRSVILSRRRRICSAGASVVHKSHCVTPVSMLVDAPYHHLFLPAEKQQSRSVALRGQVDNIGVFAFSQDDKDQPQDRNRPQRPRCHRVPSPALRNRDCRQRLFANYQLLIAYSYLRAITGSKRAAFTAG